MPKIKSVVGTYDIKRIKNNSNGTPTTIYWRNGSITHLMSAEQDDDKFEGTTIDFVWIDEPVRRNIYIGLKRGMLTTEGHLWMTCTPLDEPWIYEEIYVPWAEGRDSDIEVFEGTSDENDKISKEAKEEFRRRLTADEYDARWLGKFRHLSGRVFKEYSMDRHFIEPFVIPYHWPVWTAIDPHRNKPHAVVFIAISPDNLKYICNEIFLKCTVNELAAYILDIGSQYRVVNRLIDTSAQEQGWGKLTCRQMLSQAGVKTKLAQKKNLKNSGILLINQLFKDDEMFVFNTCKRTHKEFMNQVYKKNKRDVQNPFEEPEKKWDDCTDGVRYILVENPKTGNMNRTIQLVNMRNVINA